MSGSESDTDSERDNENTVSNVHVDPLKILQSLSILSTLKYPSITQAITLLLKGISVKNTNSPEVSTTTRKRPSNETSGNRPRAAKARKVAEEIKTKCVKGIVNKWKRKANGNDGIWKCYLCDLTFVNQSNLNRHFYNTNIHPTIYCRIINREGYEKFLCGLCGSTLSNKGNANRHLKLSHSTVGKRKRNSKEHKPEKQKLQKDIKGPDMFVCMECQVATSEIDRAVEHAQLHQLSVKYDPCPRTCDICKFTFEKDKFREHLSIHNATNKFIIQYSPLTLLNNDWYNMFQCIDDNLVNRIKASSIYKHTRKVKMNTDDSDDSSGTPIYQCEMCDTFVRPEEVEIHCNKEDACVKNVSEFYICDNCDRFFFTSEALSEHENEEKTGIRFKTITFNNVNDLPMNKALRTLKPASDSQVIGINSQTERASNSTVESDIETQQSNRNEKGNKIVILENLLVTRFCQDCGKFISVSDFKAHVTIHRQIQFAAIEDEENQNMDEEVLEEPNVSNEKDDGSEDIPEEVKNRDKNSMDSENSVSDRILESNKTSEEENLQKDDEGQKPCNSPVPIDHNTNEKEPQKQNYSKNNDGEGTEVAGGHKHVMHHMNSISCHSLDLNAQEQCQKANRQRDQEDRTANTTMQIDNDKSKIDIASTNPRFIIELDGDRIFAGFEDELRQSLQENINKIIFNDNSTKQSKMITETIEILEDSEHEDESQSRVSTPSSTLDLNKALEEDETVDDKSVLIDWFKTNDTIDLTGNDEIEENTTELNSELTANAMKERKLSDHEIFLEEERRIKETLAKRN